MAHPQPLSYPADPENVVQPLSAAIGDRDWCTSKPKLEEISQIFEKKRDNGIHVEFVEYKGAGHRFAVRYDPGNENMAKQADEAQNQAVNWFKEHFKKT